MKKFSFSILLGIISFLSIYVSIEIEYPVINLTCHYKGADDTIEDNRLVKDSLVSFSFICSDEIINWALVS